MKIIHYKDWRGNFGDDINPVFFEQVVPNYVCKMPDRKLYGIGTLLNAATMRIENAYVLGSGYGYGSSVNWDPVTVQVLGVRGPITAKVMGMEANPDIVIGDPALLIPKLPALLKGKSLCVRGLVVAPHHRTSEAWNLEAKITGKFYVLDPGLTSIQDYIATIRGAEVVLAESLHGAILAAAFNVPFIPIAICAKIDATKWNDFFSLLKINLEPHAKVPIPPPTKRRRLAVAYARSKFCPSDLRKRFHKGSRLSATEQQIFESSVLEIARTFGRIQADIKIIEKCQTLILRACERLTEILDGE